MMLSGRMLARKDDGIWGYKVMKNGGYSYNENPSKGVLLSQTNAGPCFLCKKKDFIKIHFEEELWLDKMQYALGEDQVMFYKMYKKGFKILTSYDSGIVHLDAGSTMISKDKQKMIIYSDFRFKTIFWHRFIYLPEKRLHFKFWSILCLIYIYLFAFIISLLKGEINILKLKWDAVKDGLSFIKSAEYRLLPRI